MHERNEKFDKEMETIQKTKQNPRNPRAKKYNNWTEELTRELQKQTQPSEGRISNLEDR